MAYTKITDFAVKDSLLSGNPAKLVRGTEIDAEFTELQTQDAQNVKGPGSSTDNAVARYDTITGKLLQSSTVLISDTGVISGVAAGSAAAPSISPTGDSNTGVYFPAADTVGVSTGGVERVRVDSNGAAVTGALSATGNITGSGELQLNAVNAAIRLQTGGINKWAFINDFPSAGQMTVYDHTAAVNRVVFSPTGLSVTGALSASGDLLVGQTSSGFQNADGLALSAGTEIVNHVSGTASGTAYSYYAYAGGAIGSITQSGTTAVAYNTTSDHRLKTNVRPADALRFMDIEFVDFEWTDGRHDCGVIAHQLQSVYPDLVLGEKDATEVRTVEITPAVAEVKDAEGNVITEAVAAVTEEQTFPVYQQVNYIGLIGRMGTTIQKQQRLIEAMEARLTALEANV